MMHMISLDSLTTEFLILLFVVVVHADNLQHVTFLASLLYGLDLLLEVLNLFLKLFVELFLLF